MQAHLGPNAQYLAGSGSGSCSSTNRCLCMDNGSGPYYTCVQDGSATCEAAGYTSITDRYECGAANYAGIQMGYASFGDGGSSVMAGSSTKRPDCSVKSGFLYFGGSGSTSSYPCSTTHTCICRILVAVSPTKQPT